MNTSTSTPASSGRSYYLWGGLLLALAIVARLSSYPVVSGDYVASISHWMDALAGSPGLTAFRTPFSDYAPLYLYFLKALTLVPIYRLFAVKTLSVAFDILLGVLAVAILKAQSSLEWPRPRLFLAFSIVFLIPTLVLNSSAWAQADSIYTAFVLLSLYFALKDRPVAASIAFSVALSFKLQAVFFLPVLIGYVLVRKWSLLYLVWIPVIYALSIVPAWLGGGSFLGLLGVYGQQSSEFQALSLSAPSVFSFVSEGSISPTFATVLSYLGILVALGFAAWIVRRMLAVERARRITAEEMVLFSLLAAVALPFFLPHMHERYFYMADVLSVVCACMRPSRWYLPALVVGASLFSYMSFLSGSIPFFGPLIVSEGFLGLAMLAALISLTVIANRIGGSEVSFKASDATLALF